MDNVMAAIWWKQEAILFPAVSCSNRGCLHQDDQVSAHSSGHLGSVGTSSKHTGLTGHHTGSRYTGHVFSLQFP